MNKKLHYCIVTIQEEKAQWALRQRLQNAEQSESSLINMLEDRLNQAENQIQDYRDENTVLKCELRELQVGRIDRFRKKCTV